MTNQWLVLKYRQLTDANREVFAFRLQKPEEKSSLHK
jgi:hypothetical protein